VSFEVFLQCFDHGEPAGVSRAAIRSLFPVVESESEADYWSVRYGPGSWCHIGITPFAENASLVESLYVCRPCADIHLWDSLLAVMRLGSVVLYFPGGDAPLVATATAGDQLPAEMVEVLGRPRVVRTGQEIVEIIKHS